MTEDVVREALPGEGQICRWCQEGEYEWEIDPMGPFIGSSENDRLVCSACGEEPITFETAQRLELEENTND